MAKDLDQAFVQEFGDDIKLAYQRETQKLRAMVRSVTGVRGSSYTFQKLGKGTAGPKTSGGGFVPVMNLDHDPVEVTLEDSYAGEYIDKLDELKINHDERGAVAKTAAAAQNRKADSQIVAALDANTNFAGANTDGMTKAKALTAFEALGDNDVPDDGERYALVGFKQWTELLAIDEFANSDYVGSEDLPWNGSTGKRWLGTIWCPFSGLTKTSNVRFCHWFHKTAIGHASGQDIETMVSWENTRGAHFVNAMMSQGAGLIDATGVQTLRCRES